MRKPTFRRLLAYVVDIVIVGLIASALSSVSFLNPYIKEYDEVQAKYEELVEEASKDSAKLQELLNSEEITNITYEVSSTGVFVTIYTLGVSILYFVGFQYITKGKTLGKKLMKIEVVSNDKKDLTILELLKRSIIINSLVTTLLTIIFIMTLSKDNYLNCSKYVQLVETTLIIVSAACILYREDGRGLHDLFGGTRVIMSDDKEFFLKHDKETIKEAEIVEETPKKKTTKKKEM